MLSANFRSASKSRTHQRHARLTFTALYDKRLCELKMVASALLKVLAGLASLQTCAWGCRHFSRRPAPHHNRKAETD
jgi:hypothetical protein